MQAPTAGRGRVREGHVQRAGRELGFVAVKCHAKTQRDLCASPATANPLSPLWSFPRPLATHHHGTANDAVWSREGNDGILDVHFGHASFGSHIAQVSHVPAQKHRKLTRVAWTEGSSKGRLGLHVTT